MSFYILSRSRFSLYRCGFSRIGPILGCVVLDLVVLGMVFLGYVVLGLVSASVIRMRQKYAYVSPLVRRYNLSLNYPGLTLNVTEACQKIGQKEG